MISTDTLSLSGMLSPERIRIGLEVSDKMGAINALIDSLAGAVEILDLESLRDDVFAREAILSTGVGKGLALPHARSAAVSNTLIAFGLTVDPVEYDAIDGEPIRLLLLLVGPDDERSTHVRLLGRISRLMNDRDFRTRLLNAKDAQSVIDIFRLAEENRE